MRKYVTYFGLPNEQTDKGHRLFQLGLHLLLVLIYKLRITINNLLGTRKLELGSIVI